MPTFRFPKRRAKQGSLYSSYAHASRGSAGRRPSNGLGRMGFGRGLKSRLVIALAVGGFALFSYCSSSEYNAITGSSQRVAMTANQEIALGLKAAPQMMQRHGGLHANPMAQALVDRVGQHLLKRSDAGTAPYRFEFHLLADDQTINAFALPGGQVFITQALFAKFTREDQLAGVLAHEISHVVARHGAQQMAKQQLTQGLVGAAVVGAGDYSAGQMAGMIGKMVTMKYGREDEIESDLLGVRFMHRAGYDPSAMIEVMEILAGAGGGSGQPEFFSTHPNPDNRIQRIEQAIAALD